tara:strand:+ start:1741 stop:2079 length:339 start_codon:yes stop_codon:yes gene_type:complete
MKVKDYFLGNLDFDDVDLNMEDFVSTIAFDFINDNHLSSNYCEILGIRHEVDKISDTDRFYLGWYGLDSTGHKKFASVLGFNSLINAQKALKVHTDRGDFFGDNLRKVVRWS